jgi:hypothetical protein
MTAQQISLKMKQELPMLVQPSQTDKAIVELYEDALHLAMCIDPFDTSLETYNILRKYIPEFPEKHPMDKCEFSDGFDAVKNKDTYIDDKMKVYQDLYARIHLPKSN